MATRGKQLKNTDLAYIAGFIDGEGTIGVYKVLKENAAHKKEWKPSYKLRLFITQTSLVPLEYIRNFYASHGLSAWQESRAAATTKSRDTLKR